MTTTTFHPRCSTGPSYPRRSPLCWALLALALWGVQPLLAQAPVNDSFAGAVTLSGSTNIVIGSNVAATSEPGEPAHAGNPADRLVLPYLAGNCEKKIIRAKRTRAALGLWSAGYTW